MNSQQKLYKYPRTYHAPWSLGCTSDDKKHTSMEQFKNKRVIVTEKLDGECFPSITPILMADGSKKNISDINVGDIVLGFDSNKNLVESTVLNVFKNGKTDKWLKIYFKNPFKRDKKCIICTENHELFVNGSYVKAKDIPIGSNFSHFISYYEPNKIQKEILIGKLLGDGSFSSNRAQVQYTHKIEHKMYSDFINLFLTDAYSNSLIDLNSNSYSEKPKYKSWTKSFKWLKHLSSEMLVDGNKIIPESLISQISPLSLAVLYMDDGNLTENGKQNPRMHFSICNFDHQSCLNLQRVFTNFNIKTTITNSDGYNYLHISSYSVNTFCELIKDYIPEIMQYKLPSKYRRIKVEPTINHESIFIKKLVDVEILSIDVLKDFKFAQKYDIETETHNYFANGILVHNCTTLAPDLHYARSLDSGSHVSRDWLSQFHSTISYNIPKNYRICGENVYAMHSLFYDNLESYFYAFSVWNGETCLNWDETKEWLSLLGIKHVPVLYDGIYDEKLIKTLWNPLLNAEGYVIRIADSFEYHAFKDNVAKFVRPNHVTSDTHWKYKPIIKNKLKTQGNI